MPTASWVIVYTGGAADTGVLRDLLEAAGIPVTPWVKVSQGPLKSTQF